MEPLEDRTAPSATVWVSLTGPSTAQAGSNITYLVAAGDQGPDDAQDVSITDQLPLGVSFIEATQDSGPTLMLSCSAGQVSGTVATLPAGTSASFTVVGFIPASPPNNTPLVDQAGITTTTALSDSSGTSASISTTVENNAPAATSLALTSPANPSPFGQAVTFTAAVSSPAGGTPTGTVTFTDDTTTLGTATLGVVNGQDQATLDTSSLSVGDHSITAAYGGDSTYAGSSDTLSQPVDATGGAPVISIDSVSGDQGSSGTTPFVFTVTLSAASPDTVTVNYATADGTAMLADNDYESAGGTLTFAPGDTSQTIAVNVVGDPMAEPDETFFVDLSDATNTANTSAQGTGTIINNGLAGDPHFTWAPHPAPGLIDPGDQTGAEGSAVFLQIVAGDADGDSLRYAVTNLPAGLALDAGTGLISGTIAGGAAAEFGGSYPVTVLVADGQGGIADQSFTWTVTATPRAPTLANPGSQSNVEGAIVAVQVYASSPDGSAVSFIDDGLPPGLTIDSDTGVIAGTIDPSAAAAGPYTATITATADGIDSSVTFPWTVTPTFFAPDVTNPGDQTNTAGDTVSLAIDAGDANQDALTYTVTGLPPGLSIDSGTGIIGGTIAATAASATPYSVTVTAYDGPQSAAQTFAWTVNTLGLANPGDQSSQDGDNVVLPVAGSAPPGVSLSYCASGLPLGLGIEGDTGVLSGTIDSGADAGGPYLTTVWVTDGTNWLSQSFAWTVSRTSDAAPALSAPGNQQSAEGDTVSVAVTASDPDGDTVVYDATGLPDGLSIDAWSGLISGTIADGAAANSPYTVTVTADDQNGGVASVTLTWTVGDASRSAQGASFSAQEGVPANGVTVATFTDPNTQVQAGELTAAIDWGDGLTSVGDVTPASDGSFSVAGDHTYTRPGTFSVQVALTDGDGNVTTASGTAAVSAASLAAAGGLSLTAAAGSPVTWALGSVQSGNADDPASSYAVSINWGDGTSPAAGSLNGWGGSFSVAGSHQYAADGTYTVTATITDKDGTATTLTDTMAVGDVYQGVDSTLTVGPLSLADGSATPAELSATIQWGDGRQTTVSGSPGVVGGGGRFRVTAAHTYAALGNYTVQVTLTDLSDNSTVSASSALTVVAAPVALYGADVAETAGQSFSGAVAAVFADADTTDNSSSYQGTIDWGGGVGSTTGTISALGNGLYQVVGGAVESAASGLYATGVKLLANSLAPVALAFQPGDNEAKDAGGLRKNIEGPGVVPGGGRYTYAVWFDPTPDTTVDVSKAKWAVVTNDAKRTPVAVKLVSTGLPNQDGDTSHTIGYSVTYDFPNQPTDALVTLTGLVVNGKPLTAVARRVIVVQVNVTKFVHYTSKPESKFSSSVITRSPTNRLKSYPAGTYDVLNTRPPAPYNRKTLKGTKYAGEMSKGLVGFEAQVTLTGIGTNKTEGVDKITLGWVRNIDSTFKVAYKTGSAQFQPTWNNKDVTGPFLDATRTPTSGPGPGDYGTTIGKGGGTAFTNSSTEQRDPKKDGQRSRIVLSLDAPGLAFLKTNPGTSKDWTTTVGGWSWADYLTAFGSDVNSYAVYGKVNWAYNLVGKNDGAGAWVTNDKTKILSGGDKFDTAGFPKPGGAVKGFTVKRPTWQDVVGTPQLLKYSN